MPVVIDQFEMVPEPVAPTHPAPSPRGGEPSGPGARADEIRAVLARESERSLRGRSC